MQEVECVEDKSLEGSDIHNQLCTRRVLVVVLFLLVMVVMTQELLTIANVVVNITRIIG